MFKAIFTKKFWWNVLILLLFVSLLFTVMVWSLKIYTRHGQSIEVPNFEGINVSQLDEFIKGKDLRYKISDSTYVSGQAPGTVLNQTPLAKEKVKSDRRIYLTINRQTPPITTLPALFSTSLENAKRQLENYGLVLGKIDYTPCLGKQTVNEIFINGKAIKEGDDIRKGTTVDFVLCDGIGNKPIEIPNLLGFTYTEALASIRLSQLTLGAVTMEDGLKFKEDGYVYRQQPPPVPGRTIMVGEAVDVWVQIDPIIFADEIDGVDLINDFEGLEEEADSFANGSPDPNPQTIPDVEPDVEIEPDTGLEPDIVPESSDSTDN